MPDLLIKEAELNNLVKYVNERLPTGLGLPILNFIDEVFAARQKEAEGQTDGPKGQNDPVDPPAQTSESPDEK